MTDFAPTPEQHAALDLFRSGESMVLEACAGSGKTATLQLLAESTDRRGRYLAFNKAIVEDAKRKMPENIAVSTSHSLAFGATGRQYAHRLDAPRMKSWEVARMLGVGPFNVKHGSQTKVLQPGFLSSHVMRGIERFCASADDDPTVKHLAYIDGIDVPNSDGSRTYRWNDEVREFLRPALARAWSDLTRTDGQLRFGHHVYYKLWALGRPHLDVDFVLLDEAQDIAPVLAKVFEDQTHAQRIAVGDRHQSIYAFTGAIDAMQRMDAEVGRAFLTRSFRFGPPIADVANLILRKLAAEMVISGHDPIESTVGPIDLPAAVLTRTNATAVRTLLDALKKDVRPHLIGGGKEVVSFARGAKDLQAGERTWHPELACFENWGEVQDYVDNDPAGSDLKLLVKLIDEFGADPIIGALDRMPRIGDAPLVISTAHKSKGLQFPTVRLASDFVMEDPGDEELRLLYVAATRAQFGLDDRAVRAVYDPVAAAEAARVRLGGTTREDAA